MRKALWPFQITKQTSNAQRPTLNVQRSTSNAQQLALSGAQRSRTGPTLNSERVVIASSFAGRIRQVALITEIHRRNSLPSRSALFLAQLLESRIVADRIPHRIDLKQCR